MKDLQRRLLGMLVASGAALRLGTVAAENNTIFSSFFDVTLEDVDPATVINETEDVFIKSTLAHCWNNVGTNPYAEDPQVVLDVATDTSDNNSTATRGRRRLGGKDKTYPSLFTCSACEGDNEDMQGDQNRRLRGDGSIGRRRLTFDDCFSAALMNSNFDAFQNLTGCLATLRPDAKVTTVEEWVETVYIEPFSDSPTVSRLLQVNDAATHHLEGDKDLVCRHDPDDPELGGSSDPLTRGKYMKDNVYYRVAQVKSELECQMKCMQSADCGGLEYSDFYGKTCKLWKATSSIGLMKQEDGFSCYRKVPDVPPEAQEDESGSPVTTADDPASTTTQTYYEGGPGKSCRAEGTNPKKGGPKDGDAQGRSNKYFDVYGRDEGIDTLDKCKVKCSEKEECKGYGWRNDVNVRCEIWKSKIGLMMDMGDDISFECHRKALPPMPNPVLRFGQMWEDDYGLNGIAASAEERYRRGDHWVRTGTSTLFQSAYEGFKWKSLGGLQYDEGNYVEFMAGRMGLKTEDLPVEQMSAVKNFSERMSSAARNFRANPR